MKKKDVRQRLTPQMKDYDNLKVKPLPYIMFLHQPNYSSASVNTDNHGLRISTDPEGVPLSINTLKERSCNLLVGGSTAFGVGATSDKNTISGHLSTKTQDCWLNFAGRSFSSTQELILFQTYFEKLSSLKKIIIFSGLNNLVLNYLSYNSVESFGSFYHWTLFKRTMEDALATPNSRRIIKLLRPFIGDDMDYSLLTTRELLGILFSVKTFSVKRKSFRQELEIRDNNRERLIPLLKRELEIWKYLADSLNVKLEFYLQPFFNWMDKVPTSEEREIFAFLDAEPQNQFKILSTYISPELHAWYSDMLKSICDLHKIQFIDMNPILSKSLSVGDWAFVDRAHLSDLGNDRVTDAIISME